MGLIVFWMYPVDDKLIPLELLGQTGDSSWGESRLTR